MALGSAELFLGRGAEWEARERRGRALEQLGGHVGALHIFDIFYDCSMFFLHCFFSLHFDGYQDRFFMDVCHLFKSFLEVFFRIFGIVGK